MSADQIEESPGESPKRIFKRDEVKKGALYCLVSETPNGVRHDQLVTIVDDPYLTRQYPHKEYLVKLMLNNSDPRLEQEIVLPLAGLGIMPKPNRGLVTNMWLEPYMPH